MKAKIIKGAAEYEAALAHIETLMDAAPGSPEAEELELFALLVEQYEKENYPIDLPDPIDAILFRIEQQPGLTRRDLAIYLGSHSKVSEVLNRKRPLSLTMIRNLHEGLGIPADILLREPGRALPPVRYDCRDYPFAQMLKAGYFGEWRGSLQAAKDRAEELMGGLFAVYGDRAPERVYCRRSEAEIDINALAAWQARVLALTQAQAALPPYNPRLLGEALFRKLIRASYFSNGPQLVPKLLGDHGIHFVLLEHLPKTYLDGAAFLSPNGRPVVAMTLRHDRLDNFWFTLIHELVHVQCHLQDNDIAFFDDTEDGRNGDHREHKANESASNFLIPVERWQEARTTLMTADDDAPIMNFAEQLEISPAIVAGRIRWESGDYTRFPHLIGRGEVRKLFG